MKPGRGLALVLALALVGAALGHAEAACPGYSVCPSVDFTRALRSNAGARAVLSGVDSTEAAVLGQIANQNLNFQQIFALLGEAIVFDRSLSAGGNEACALCHTQPAGFAGGIGVFNRETVVYPGSVTSRAGSRKPMNLAYAAFAPVLSLDTSSGVFVGGNFWDSRATGLVTGSPAADQALIPFVSPFEMALPDPACAAYRISLGPYASLFTSVWGAASLAIDWPAGTGRLCARPNDGRADQTPLRLSHGDRDRATLTYTQIADTVAAFEASTYASPFSAKYDLVQAGQAVFTTGEAAGFKLFTGRAKCVQCHGIDPARPVFTNYTSANIGVPQNPENPFLTENVADRRGYVANPLGRAFRDSGLGGFLASDADENSAWRAQAARYMGAFQVPVLRNVAQSPGPGFPHTYMHNGYFHDLRVLVHFLNTRDVLPRCSSVGETGCWPAPETPQNIDRALTGNLGLTSADEDRLVQFLGTLTDGG
jgi:cytochrome c peroxidase